MTNPPPPAPIESEFGKDDGSIWGGVWSLRGDRLVRIDRFPADHPFVVLVPSEHVLMLAVQLPPLGGMARRRDALPFAIEDRITQPLDQVHVALGAEIAAGVWLAGVVDHAVMADWLAVLNRPDLNRPDLMRAAIVPDALGLPIPAPDGWSVDLANGRAVVRAADGTGFALPLAALETAWRAAGQPACTACGDPLPPLFSATRADQEYPSPGTRMITPALNLRQGAYAPPRRAISPLWRRAALVAGMGVLAHGIIAIADTAALNHLARARAAHVRTLAAGLQPPVVLDADLGDALGKLTPDPAVAGPSRFMTLLSRSAAAMQTAPQPSTQAGTVWRSVAFDQPAGTLTIEVEASDMAQLPQIAKALARAGLNAQPGAASREGGHAVGTFVIRAS